MSYFGLADVNSVGILFSSMGRGTAGNNAISAGNTILADYASIRNGSYHRLLKAYYNEESGFADRVESSTETSKDSVKELTQMEEAGEGLREAADALITRGSKNVFQKVPVKAEDGTTTTGYQTEEIYKKVNDFVEEYNNLIEVTEESNTGSIARASAQMISLTNVNERLLEDIGITINKDDTLSIDKETFLKADMNKVKSLFNGTGSYAYNVEVKASMIEHYAKYEAAKANTYGPTGYYNYNYSNGSNYNGYI